MKVGHAPPPPHKPVPHGRQQPIRAQRRPPQRTQQQEGAPTASTPLLDGSTAFIEYIHYKIYYAIILQGSIYIDGKTCMYIHKGHHCYTLFGISDA